MAVELAPISGVIDLKDDYTKTLDFVAKELLNFESTSSAVFAGIAAAGTLVVATFTGIALAAKELGERGADILDVEATLQDFAGGVGAAAKVMEELRAGTKGTINDFDLAKKAAHLLSAGVRLTADEFGTLSQAAFVLQNRGLGGTKEMLDLVSDAMVTGRTKALAKAVGVSELVDIEETYAKTLGVSANMLSESAKVEGKRVAILGLLSEAVKKAGVQERDFGEQIEAARVFVGNWVDEIAKAVAASPVLAAGMEAIGTAIQDAFGGDSQTSIDATTSLIENTAIVATNFALGLVEAARVVHAVWSGLQTVILGVMTAISETVSLIPGMADGMREWTKSLGEQTAEAARGVAGTSEFDKTLDKLGGTIYQVRDAMVDAQKSTKDHSATLDIASENTKKLAALQDDLAAHARARALDAGKLAEMEKKSLETIKGLTAEHLANVVKMTGTSYDAQKAAIEANFTKQVEVLDKLNPKYKEHYAALRQAADDALMAIGSDWDSVRDKSIEGMRQQAEKARELYNKMASSSLHFTRDDLEEQLRKTRELEDAARGMGTAYTESLTAAATAAQILADKQEAINEKLAEEKELRRTASVTSDIKPLTQTEFENLGGSGRVTSGDGGNQGAIWRKLRMLEDLEGTYAPKSADSYFAMIKDQILLSQLRQWAADKERPPGFGQGGMVDIMVGENGPEVARVPLGTQVFPTGMEPTSKGNNITLIFNVNGTAEESAQKIKKILMKDYTLTRQVNFG